MPNPYGYPPLIRGKPLQSNGPSIGNRSANRLKPVSC